MSKYIELSSANRNREQFPLVSYFEVPFAPTVQNGKPDDALDPVVNGTIYYSFTLYPPNIILASGMIQPGSGPSAIRLDPNGDPTPSQVPNFYKGYTFTDTGTGESRIVRSYRPSTGYVTFEKPFSSISAGAYNMFIGFATANSIFIPTVDDYGNPIDTNELAYNGYYVVFESPLPEYSNADNSNIFYRQISYYDNVAQIAYFDKPLPFNYKNVLDPQRFTLRKTLPLERWTIQGKTYFNYTLTNPVAGPLLGTVIQLPPTAPSEDNYFKGKYVYFYSNTPEFFSPPLPAPWDLVKPILYVFYPIYGAYYIRAYNGTTKQLSVRNDINNIPPPTNQTLDYNTSSFVPLTNVSSIANLGMSYQAFFTPSGGGPTYQSSLALNDTLYEIGKTYQITWSVRKSPNMVSTSFTVPSFIDYTSPTLTDDYQTLVWNYVGQVQDLNFIFTSTYNPVDAVYVEWNYFEMRVVDTINITAFSNDNFSPMFYSGTMVSVNEAVCYDISLASLSLPNLPLRTGSTIAFYPFIYVLLENVTAPSTAATNVIYSNNPNTSRALFIAPCFPTADPSVQDYISLSSSTYHTIKFKPNDNLRFAVYLADGRLFDPLVPDILSPYDTRPRNQVTAVFSIYRNSQGR